MILSLEDKNMQFWSVSTLSKLLFVKVSLNFWASEIALTPILNVLDTFKTHPILYQKSALFIHIFLNPWVGIFLPNLGSLGIFKKLWVNPFLIITNYIKSIRKKLLLFSKEHKLGYTVALGIYLGRRHTEVIN